MVEDRAEALAALPDLSATGMEAMRATGTDDGDPRLGVVLASCLASKGSKRVISGNIGQRGRGVIATGASKEEGPSTLDKANVNGPSHLVEIGGVEPPASRVRF